jgi:hypothetical protein
MTDTERLHQWLKERDMTLYGLGQQIGMRYNTLWYMVVDRNTVSDKFITRFIRHFGCDEALVVFADALKRVESDQSSE